MMDRVIFMVAVFATLFCAAVNAYTYQVAYPLWRSVGAAELPALHSEYLRRLWPVITVPHVVMFFASGALILRRPIFLPLWWAVVLFGLEAGVVIISAFAAGPIHGRITKLGVLDDTGYRRLMGISLMRVGMMALACGLIFAAMLRAMMVVG